MKQARLSFGSIHEPASKRPRIEVGVDDDSTPERVQLAERACRLQQTVKEKTGLRKRLQEELKRLNDIRKKVAHFVRSVETLSSEESTQDEADAAPAETNIEHPSVKSDDEFNEASSTASELPEEDVLPVAIAAEQVSISGGPFVSSPEIKEHPETVTRVTIPGHSGYTNLTMSELSAAAEKLRALYHIDDSQAQEPLSVAVLQAKQPERIFVQQQKSSPSVGVDGNAGLRESTICNPEHPSDGSFTGGESDETGSKEHENLSTETTFETSLLLRLDDNLLLHIASFLPIKDIFSLACSCRRLAMVCSDKLFFRRRLRSLLYDMHTKKTDFLLEQTRRRFGFPESIWEQLQQLARDTPTDDVYKSICHLSCEEHGRFLTQHEVDEIVSLCRQAKAQTLPMSIEPRAEAAAYEQTAYVQKKNETRGSVRLYEQKPRTRTIVDQDAAMALIEGNRFTRILEQKLDFGFSIVPHVLRCAETGGKASKAVVRITPSKGKVTAAPSIPRHCDIGTLLVTCTAQLRTAERELEKVKEGLRKFPGKTVCSEGYITVSVPKVTKVTKRVFLGTRWGEVADGIKEMLCEWGVVSMETSVKEADTVVRVFANRDVSVPKPGKGAAKMGVDVEGKDVMPVWLYGKDY